MVINRVDKGSGQGTQAVIRRDSYRDYIRKLSTLIYYFISYSATP